MPYKDFTKNAECKRTSALWRKYKITPAQYNALFIKQSGRCAICEKHESEETRWKRLAVDHCHKTGRVRGLLCTSCNVRVGIIENTELNLKVSEYLNQTL